MLKLCLNKKGNSVLMALMVSMLGVAGLAFIIAKSGQFSNQVIKNELTANLSEEANFNLIILQKKFQSSLSSTGGVVLPDWYPNPYPIPSEMAVTTNFKPQVATMMPPGPKAYVKASVSGTEASLDLNASNFILDGSGLGWVENPASVSSASNQSAYLGVPSFEMLTAEQKKSFFSPDFHFPLDTAIKSVPVQFKKYLADDPSTPNTLTKMIVQVGDITGIIPIALPPAPTSCSLSLTSPSEPIDVNIDSVSVKVSLSVDSLVESIAFDADGSDNPKFQMGDFDRQSLKDYGVLKNLKTDGFNLSLSKVSTDLDNPSNSQEFLRVITASVRGHAGNTVSCEVGVRIKKNPGMTPTDLDVCVGSVSGGTVTKNGIKKVVTFSADGSLRINKPCKYDVFVIGGGGGGGCGNKAAGGGGGGGLVLLSNKTLNQGTYTVTVGAGGAARTKGRDSSLVGNGENIVASGGGNGGDGENCPNHTSSYPGVAGGSGGGGGQRSSSGPGGAGIVGQGNAGGAAKYGNTIAGGGGGGAGGKGAVGDGVPGTGNMTTKGGAGGAGLGFDIYGLKDSAEKSVLSYYSGGGGGQGEKNSQPGGVGGAGGSGVGGSGASGNIAGANGIANTGGGGGGGNPGGSGGSGVVIITYQDPTALTCTGLQVKWSETNHGKCDWSVTGNNIAKVTLSNGTTTTDSIALNGTVDCSPWDGNYGDLSFSATAYDVDGIAVACPNQKLLCHRQAFHPVAGAPTLDGRVYATPPYNPARATITVDSNGLYHKEKKVLYRHWLYIDGLTNASSGLRGVSIGANKVSGNYARFAGLRLAVGNTPNVSRYGSGAGNIDVAKKETPLLNGDVQVQYWGSSQSRDGAGPGLGIYIVNCTNGKPAPAPTAVKGDGSLFYYDDGIIKQVINLIKAK